MGDIAHRADPVAIEDLDAPAGQVRIIFIQRSTRITAPGAAMISGALGGITLAQRLAARGLVSGVFVLMT
ncbi:MAG TPA: hypothetical protein VNW15_01865 [Rhizomicrobium sp.]|jgi:hypothetical protein|nr:hypothetical protein [Rhizomicrobium sp.]